VTSDRSGWLPGWRGVDSLTFCRPGGLTCRMACRPPLPGDHRRDPIGASPRRPSGSVSSSQSSPRSSKATRPTVGRAGMRRADRREADRRSPAPIDSRPTQSSPAPAERRRYRPPRATRPAIASTAAATVNSTAPCIASLSNNGNWDPDAAAYLARKQAEGKPRKEALRCLKRDLARRVWKLLRPTSEAALADVCLCTEPESADRSAPSF
jgi:hypothetical protein